MQIEERHALQREGATARAAGRSPFDNPFYAAEKMPAATGETVASWNERAEAWSFGFEMEHAMRRGAGAAELLR